MMKVTTLATVIVCASLSLTAPSGHAAENTVRLSAGAVKVVISPGAKPTNYIIELTGPGKMERSSAFVLRDPARVVVDLEASPVAESYRKEIAHEAIAAMRVGTHPDRTRVVFDLKGESVPTISTKSPGKNNLLRISLAFGEMVPEELENGATETSPQAAVSEEPDEPDIPSTVRIAAASRESDPVPTPVPGSTVPTAKKELPAASPPEASRVAPPAKVITIRDGVRSEVALEKTKAQTPALSAIAHPAPQAPTNLPAVNGIYFRTIDARSTPGVLIDAPGLQNYWFSRRTDKLFEVVLEKSRLGGDHLTLPQFPPQNFIGFEAVNAEQKGADVLVRVYVQGDYRIAPFRKDGQLWLKLVNAQ